MSNAQYTDFTQALTAPQRFTTALYMGPGLTTVAATLSGRHADRFVAFSVSMTEPARPDHTSDPFSQIAIHPALLSTDDDVTLRNFNIKGYTALRPATGLRQVFPGLRETTQNRVETVAPQDALDRAALEGTGNLLILGAAGFEMDVLNAVLPTDGPSAFSRIVLMLPRVALYMGGSDGQALEARLEQASYRRVWMTTSDPDMPVAAFDLDRARLAERRELSALREEYSAVCTRLNTLEAVLDTTQRDLDSTAQQLSEAEMKASRLETQIRTRRAQQSGALAQAFKEMDAQAATGDAGKTDPATKAQRQNLQQADLVDLRRRYQSLKSENDHLSDLLGRVYHSLNALKRGKPAKKKTSKPK